MTAMTTLNGDLVRLDGDLDRLADSLTGELVRAGDGDYDEARALWNAMTSRTPAAVARCSTTGDVAAVVRFAREHDLLLAVRSGGHNVAGTAGVDDGLVVDLSTMNHVEVDTVSRRVHVGGGATLADIDPVTQAHGLATPLGKVSQTGIGGLTLSGGLGWLRRKHGLTCDNLVAATLVAADGAIHEVDEERDPELLWGLRGGGGNFGIVTEFTFQLHPVGPDVFAAIAAYRSDRVGDALRAFRDWTAEVPDEVSAIASCGTVPHDDHFPEEHWGEPFVILAACAAADLVTGEALVRPIRELDGLIADLSGPVPYVELQQMFDADYPDGMRHYWRSHHLPGLSDEVIECTLDWMHRRPSPLSTLDIWHLGGAMSRVAPDATAYGDRSDPYLLALEANWEAAADDDANLRWARGCIDAFEPLSTGREYLNFPGFYEDGERSLRAAHGEANYARLVDLKRRLDAANLFRLHQNVPPDAPEPG